MKHSTGYNYKEGKPIAIAIENLQPISKEQSSETHAYPTDEKGEPIFELMPTDQAVEMLSEIGEYADGLVSTNVKSAKKAYDDAMQKKPKATSFNAIRAEIEAIKKEQAAAKARYDAWVAISKAMKAQKEQKPTEKFIEGMEKTKTMPNGTKLKGRYVLVSPDILIPSHNPMDGWKTTEGFPVNDKGQNINDRDYEHDKAAQQFTEQIGQNYGGQAVEQVPTISNEGIVYDGNGRVMAGQIAAANNTDADYMQTLRDNAASFGFTPEQIDAIPHARVVFMLDENLPYTTETFAQFNT